MLSRRRLLSFFVKLGALLPAAVCATPGRPDPATAETAHGQALLLYKGCVLRREDLSDILSRRR